MTRASTSETSSHQPVYSNNSPETTHPGRQRERKIWREREWRRETERKCKSEPMRETTRKLPKSYIKGVELGQLPLSTNVLLKRG